MIDRRSLLIAAVAALADARAGFTDETATFPLWPEGPPGGGGPVGPVQVNDNGAISHIATPSLEVFAPARPNGSAVLVAGGGGYKRIGMESESRPAARWLAGLGVTAFVLAYRLPGEGWRDGPLAPLQDAQRALRLIRAGVGRFAIQPNRVGALGFSAGGHLLGLASARSAFASYTPQDRADAFSARPDVAMLIYPVITLESPYERTSTREMLVGDYPDPKKSAEWSVQTHVRADCPPMFLVQAVDDPTSDPANTLIMAEACRAAGVPVELHRLPSGGHGFGMGRPGTPPAEWPDWGAAWLKTQGFLPA